MERRRFGRLSTNRRTVGGVGALVAAALGVGLLVPDWSGTPDQSGERKPDSTPALLNEAEARAKAVATGKRVEVTALRDATSTTYAKPNGRFELSVNSSPFRAKIDGEWQPIDTTLERVADGWAPKASVDPVVFHDGSTSHGSARKAGSTARAAGAVRPAVYTVTRDGGSTTVQAADEDTTYSPLVTMTSNGHDFTLSWPGALPEPVISGDRALYRDVLPDVDLLMTARDSGFSHLLVVHNADAAADPALEKITYGLSSPDLVFQLDEVTKVVTAEDGDGTEYAVSPTPMMWDSAGTPDITEGDDPEPAEPSEESNSSATPEEDEPITGETEAPSGGLDTEGPEPRESSDETSESPTSVPEDETSADPASYRKTTAGKPGYRQAALSRSTDGLTDDEVLALTGLAGPLPGTHAAAADADLSDAGSTDTTLTVTPKQSLLTGQDTEWPVFIDPAFTGPSTNWTTIHKRFPNYSFYDGANYNSGTTEARVGYESDTWGTTRSYFRLSLTNTAGVRKLKDAVIYSATLRTMETYAWSCSGRVVEVWHTGGISSSTTWNDPPEPIKKVTSKDVAHGWKSSCPDDYVEFNTKSLVQEAADDGWKSVTVGLRATADAEGDDGTPDPYSWKKFAAEYEKSPRLRVEYNHKPATPSSLDMNPGPKCDRDGSYGAIGQKDLELSAKSSDADGDLDYLQFQVWENGKQDSRILTLKATDLSSSTGQGSVTIAWDRLLDGTRFFKDGATYYWRVKAVDSFEDGPASSAYAPTAKKGLSAYCGFKFDGTRPNPPDVSSVDFPEESPSGDVWSEKKLGESGVFTFGSTQTDVGSYKYSFNGNSCSKGPLTAAIATYDDNGFTRRGMVSTLTTGVPLAGPNVLYVCAVDTAGNVSDATAYVFYVTPRDVPDKAGDVTGDTYPDLYAINESDDLVLYPGNSAGDIHRSLNASHFNGTSLDCDLTAEDEDEVLKNCWTDATGATPALIAHHSDSYPGDGMTDLFARMPNSKDKRLYLYKGDGYGSVDASQRLAVYLPDNAPDPATFTQMIVGDYDLDKRPDLFATTEGGGMWAFTGYSGASFRTATQISATAWAVRDLVSVGDHNADGAPDLLWRSEASDRLLLRFGIKATGGGSTLESLTTAAASSTGADEVYAEGWSETVTPVNLMYGTPDATADGIPDIWALAGDGSIKLYAGGASTIGTGTAVISADGNWKSYILTFG
ncbi:FG-GAP-like repeat-containing protein [Streptomyces fulvoviolaceus]|uniref:FG-GAP-like repeat-containing protein n=1 Tax=Streptomyces fulvoviolaceus TaxID=285535 RepID=UPI0021C0D40F|nr:FG-GAP-like repeat-containing protein [Streptomyces fulvoviolaceus]MCT9078969.1 DNRLRE domain-containing protein [Streptomyces fulvoviolaceus]